MAVETYILTFTKEMADRPVIATISKKYNVTPVLQKAQLSETAGWVQIALHGDTAEIQRALADLLTQGVMVGPPHLQALSGPDVNPLP